MAAARRAHEPTQGRFREVRALLPVEEQLGIIMSGATQVAPIDELRRKLGRGEPLNVKLGVDPTTPDLHLGHAVPLRKMRQLQDLGHHVTLIIGDGTALIGDPSGRDSTRPQLTEGQVEENARTYVEQAMKVLDPGRTTVAHNGDWLKPLDLQGMLGLMSRFNVARILEREDFHARHANGRPISLHEFVYPVLQAYDSVVVKADIELGGNDQVFNLLAGRDLMRAEGMEPQVALTMPLLVGLDGHRKMSKSYGNYVGLTDPPAAMFGKLMSVPDGVVPMYFRLCSTLPIEEVDAIDAGFADGTADPYALKRRLARDIVGLYHGDGEGERAQAAFDAQFGRGEMPEGTPEFAAADVVRPGDDGLVHLPRLIVGLGLARTTSEARRLIDGGGVRVSGEVARAYDASPASLMPGTTIQVGRRRWARLA